jgi:hypothetical protein
VRFHSAAAVACPTRLMSSHCSHDGRPSTTPAIASTRTGDRRSATVSAADTTIAVDPSQGTSQSYSEIGVEIIRPARYSSSVSGFVYTASGLRAAQERCVTGIQASCSRVTPNSCMYRIA